MKFLESDWYLRSPVFVQEAAVSAYGLASRILRNGAEFRRLLRELEESQWYSPEEFRALQCERLTGLIEHCYEHVPYYREIMDERKLKPSDITTPEDIEKLPFLTKDIIRQRSDDLTSHAPDRGRLYKGVSSGSTGTPLVTYRDAYCVSFEQASIWRHWRMAGLDLGCRRVTMRADPVAPLEQQTPPFWRRNWSENQLIVSPFHMSKERTRSYVDAMRAFGTEALQAIPSAAYFLASEMLEQGLRLDLKAVFTGSEPLYPTHREAIEEAFGCKVFDFFGQSERVSFAMECPEHTGLHVAPEYGVTEFADPGWDAGGLKEIVATGLANRAMPLIRYRTGDFVELVEGECPCGRKMPRLGPLEVRIGGAIMLPDGRFLPWVLLNLAVYGVGEIRKSQFIQERMDHLTVKVVPGDGFGDDDRQKLVANIKRYAGEGVDVDVETVEDIEREKSGKYRFVISSVTTPYEESGE
jgi:phenylacetate-CoA ligase